MLQTVLLSVDNNKCNNTLYYLTIVRMRQSELYKSESSELNLLLVTRF